MMIFCELNKKEFTAFIETQPLNDFLQSVEMEEIGKLTGNTSYYVGVKDNDKIIAASRIMLKKGQLGYYCYAPRGLILDYNNDELLNFFIKELKSYLKAKKACVLMIDPKVKYKERDINGDLVENGFDNSAIVEKLKSLGFEHSGFNRRIDGSKQVRWVFALSIKDKTKEDIWNEMKANTRNLIRKAEKFGVQIKELKKDELDVFKNITEDTSNRKNFADRDLNYYKKMYSLFVEQGKAKFLLATLSMDDYIEKIKEDKKVEEEKLAKIKSENKAKEIKDLIKNYDEKIKEAKKIKKEDGPIINLSAAMFMIYGNEVIYLFSGNIDKYMKFNAQYLMQWYMIQYAIDHKLERYNFYGISGIFDKNDKDYGVYEFKRHFNGTVEEYIGNFSLSLSPLYKIKTCLQKLKK